MKWFKIILFSILNVINAYVLYSAIGYLVLGIQTPKIEGIDVKNTTFTGMYMMSITYAVAFVLLTTIIIILGIKFFGHKQKQKEYTQK